MTTHQPDGGTRLSRSFLLALAAAAVGLVLVAVAVASQVGSPQPPRSAGRIDSPTSSPSGTSGASGPVSTGKRALAASPPALISIPAIGVRARVLPIGLGKGGVLAVPQPGPNLNKAAWYDKSPTPGQPGPSVIEGHVDSTSGPSVFYRLGAIKPGDKVHVTRRDGIEVVFTVNAVRDYPKSRFPTSTVYGSKDLSRPELRLITCSDFNAAIGHHTGNEVVFAHLTATRHPKH